MVMHHARMDEWGAREWNVYLQEELARRFKAELARDKFLLERLGQRGLYGQGRRG